MNNFAVLSARSALHPFKSMDGYMGAIFMEKADDEISLNVKNPAREIDSVYIQFSNHAALNFYWRNLKYFSNFEIRFFDIEENDVVIMIDNEEAETCLANLPARKLMDSSEGLELLNTFDEIKFYTQGQISYEDAMALFILLTQFFSNRDVKSLVGLEIGSWLGSSTYFLAKTIQILSNEGSMFCMDRWANWVIDETAENDNNRHWEIARNLDIFGNFRGIMQTFNVWDMLRPMLMDAQHGLPVLGADTFDFIFIDAGHQYAPVFHDIGHAIRILKPGGVLLCHDCGGYEKDFPVALIEKEKNNGPTHYNGRHCYLGVTKALSEYFGSTFKIFPGSTVAFKKITIEDKDKAKKMSEYS